jgi:VWFA-related protein
MMLESRIVRALGVFALALTLQCGQAIAQSKNSPNSQASSTPVFTSHSQLVLVPVVVKDHNGTHITGLTKQDFVVKEDGTARKLAFCDEIKTTAEKVPPQQKSDKTSFSNFQGQPSARRIVILTLDAINTPFAAQADARKQLIKYLSDAVDPDALVSLIMVRRGGVKVIHDFTTNPAVLMAALKKVRGVTADVETIEQITPEDDPVFQDEVNDLTAFEQGEAENVADQQRMAILSTLDALQQIAHSYAGVPGRKALIWVTAGFPFSINGSDALMSGASASTSSQDDLQLEYEHMWALLNDANIAVYPVDVRGLENPTLMDASIGKTPPRAYVTRQMLKHQDSLDTFRSFADMTGGKAFYNTNDLAKGFRDAAQDAASYYMLGYYLDQNERPGWHRLKVDVHHSGATSRARNGFFVEDNADPQLRKNDLEEAEASPLDFTGLPLTVRWDSRIRVGNSPKTKLDFEVLLPANALEIDDSDANHLSFDVVAVAKLPDGTGAGETGQTVASHLKPETAEKIRKNGMNYRGFLELPKGSYTVRFVVRDNLSHRVGSVAAPIEVD